MDEAPPVAEEGVDEAPPAAEEEAVAQVEALLGERAFEPPEELF